MSRRYQLTGDGATYTYNARGQQATYSKSGVTASYTYLPTGLRKSKTVGVITTNYVWDGQNMVYEYNGTNTTGGTAYYYGLTLISQGNNAYYLYNGHGDVVQLVTGTGTLGRSYEYDAFGNEVNPSATDTNPFRYAGQYFDTETGTYYLRARYYDPSLGRFTQQDSWAFADINDPLSLNLYTYCYNNPVYYFDPGGRFAIPVILMDIAKSAVLVGISILGIMVVDDMVDSSGDLIEASVGILDELEEKRQKSNELINLAILQYKIGPETKIAEKVDFSADRYEYYAPRIHHIVAQTAKKAKLAQIILETVKHSVHDPINLVVIPHGIHKGLHTESYYNYINERLRIAFLKADNEKKQRINVDTTLIELQLEIIEYTNTGVAPWLN